MDSLGAYIHFRDKNDNFILTKKIGYGLIQKRVLNRLEPFLSSDLVDYDMKLRVAVLEFEKIAEKINSQSFKVRIPENVKINNTSFNNFYDVVMRVIMFSYPSQARSL